MESLTEYALYIHVPFCSTKCTYCAFNTYIDLDDLIQPYVDALIKEIQHLSTPDQSRIVKSIFFGGGTPSLLTFSQFQSIFSTIHRSFEVNDAAEITLESNPNDLNESYAQQLLDVGFNRISIGMQSAVENELQLFNRQHTTETVVDAVNFCRKAGFKNLNLDLIYGNPYQTLDQWRYSLETALDLHPEHFSLYGLELKGGTSLRDDVMNGAVPAPDDDLAADMYDLATELLAEHGFEQYEISNWSKSGRQSQHNLQYWHNLPYLGLGPGAHGFANGYRYSTVLAPQRYIDLLNQSDEKSLEFPRTPAVAKSTKVKQQDEIAETIMMGLRLTQEGVDRNQFHERFGVDIVELHRETLKKYVGFDLIQIEPDRVLLTQQGRLLSNTVLADLI
jgi:oxygen-independent coproporphyrinogen-3 oxidase